MFLLHSNLLIDSLLISLAHFLLLRHCALGYSSLDVSKVVFINVYILFYVFMETRVMCVCVVFESGDAIGRTEGVLITYSFHLRWCH